MNGLETTLVVVGALTVIPVTVLGANKHYPVNREPLAETAFAELPLGVVRPTGWLRDQLTIQADGLTGHLDEFWPSLIDSAWRGGQGEGWERGVYYLDGLVPLAYVLDDPRLIAKVKGWIEDMIASARPDGWFGPGKNKDRWPLAVALKVLAQYHEATGDERALKVIQNYFRYINDNPPDWPDNEWRGVRAMENVVVASWLYRRTGDPSVLKAASSIQANSFDWIKYFVEFPYKETSKVRADGFCLRSHVVNIGMAAKHAGLWYQYSKDPAHREAVYIGLDNLDKYHGQAAGRFSGDEHLAGKSPTQGTELCAVVEFMFSLEKLVAILGDVKLADRLELLAYNANPGTCTADYWAHQYDQQANQVLVSQAKRHWMNNGDMANIYGLEPHFGCCTANMHQGWPKFVSHMWMATHDQGLAAVAYGPSLVKAKVGDGGQVTITQETDYPFDGMIRFTIGAGQPVEFPLHLRIPAWAEGAKLTAGGENIATKAGSFTVVKRTWKPGDVVELVLPMKLRTETRYNNAVSILRGPLCFALKIGEKWTQLAKYSDKFPSMDWQIEPTTPWNYGLLIDPANPEASITVAASKVGQVPYDTAAAPVVLKVKGRRIPDWKLVDDQAGETPASPAASNQPDTELELIPYGSTRLRITEFPVIKP
ncbi:MAG TPA: beta-L-arabinofuranosidase domain-containing protein [Phycisphaerae bacterium]|nr:beta-L-arabinofuranosidase domain-containing protein [Phycisphaerae bacterium]